MQIKHFEFDARTSSLLNREFGCSVWVSFRLHQGAEGRRFTLADFPLAPVEVSEMADGLFRGFRQWTLRGRNDQLELKLHVLAYPGEPSVIIEPEIVNHSGTECGLSDLRLQLAVANRPGVNAELISGKPEYVVRLGAATYVMPYDSCTWRGSLADLATRPPVHNCGHVALTEGDHALAFWYPVGHNTNCGGRTGYVHMPLTATVAGELSFPLYQPCHGPDPAHVFPLKPGNAHRSFGIVFTTGQVEHGDPWSVVRRARAAATQRAPAGERPLPPVGGGTWNWPISDGSNFLESERQLYFRHPPKRPHPETPHAEDTCREEYIRALLPHWKALGCEFVWIDLLPLYTGTFEEATDRFPSGLKPLCEQLRREGLAVSMILMPDNLNFGKWNAALEARFGNCRHTNPAKNYLCLASPWGNSNALSR